MGSHSKIVLRIQAKLQVLAIGALGVFVLLGTLFPIVRENLYFNISAAIVLLGAGAWAALAIGRDLTRRLGNINSAARSFGVGNFHGRLASGGADEIARLENTFDEMAARLEEMTTRFNELDNLKSEFVSSVSHELRTPLTTIKTLTRLLLREDLSEEKRREYLQTISVECDRQIDFVLNLLDLSRLEGGVFRLSPQRFDCYEVIKSCVKAAAFAAEKRGHSLEIKPSAGTTEVFADPKALRRVVGNLIENSIKYTPDGGRIILNAEVENEFALITVEDNGRGIPTEDLPILFDKFYREHRRAPPSAAMGNAVTDADFFEDADVSGVGLGLYLAKNVMERMGGRIAVETEVGRGTTFTLYLPLSENGATKNGAKIIGG